MLTLVSRETGGLVTVNPADIVHFQETAHATEIRFRGGSAVLVAEPYWQVAQLLHAYLADATRERKSLTRRLFASVCNLF